jgi:hypothetical protein
MRVWGEATWVAAAGQQPVQSGTEQFNVLGFDPELFRYAS